VPRILGLEKIKGKYYVTSQPVNELNDLNISNIKLQNLEVNNFDLTSKTGKLSLPVSLKFSSEKIDDFSISVSNTNNEKVVIGYDKATDNYYIDRTSSGKTDFKKNFAARVVAPRISNSPNMDMILIIDKSSVEIFADKGLTNMTAIFFPNEPYSRIVFHSQHFKIKDLQYHELKSIWNQK
jgi:fructan beta-fructosidase